MNEISASRSEEGLVNVRLSGKQFKSPEVKWRKEDRRKKAGLHLGASKIRNLPEQGPLGGRCTTEGPGPFRPPLGQTSRGPLAAVSHSADQSMEVFNVPSNEVGDEEVHPDNSALEDENDSCYINVRNKLMEKSGEGEKVNFLKQLQLERRNNETSFEENHKVSFQCLENLRLNESLTERNILEKKNVSPKGKTVPLFAHSTRDCANLIPRQQKTPEPSKKEKFLNSLALLKTTCETKGAEGKASDWSKEAVLQKLAQAKSISSRSFEGCGLEEPSACSGVKFAGCSSISSDEYFGRETPRANSAFPIDVEGVKDSLRSGVTKVAGNLSRMAGGIVSSLHERYLDCAQDF